MFKVGKLKINLNLYDKQLECGTHCHTKLVKLRTWLRLERVIYRNKDSAEVIIGKVDKKKKRQNRTPFFFTVFSY